MTGREKCDILRNIRINIAKMNGIEYDPTPCPHDGPCIGTCPKCDNEARQIYEELRRMESSGVQIKIDVQSIGKFHMIARENEFDSNIAYRSTMLLGDIKATEHHEHVPIKSDEDILGAERDDDDSMLQIEENRMLYDKGISIEDIPLIQQACKGCKFYDSIRIGNNGCPRCDALSEYFFLNGVTESSCPIKKYKNGF